MNITERVNDLQEFIKSGRVLDAMTEFYAPDVSMQENANSPTVGLAPNIERERQFLAQVKDWKGYTVKAVASSGDTSLVESVIEFINQQDQPVRMEQVASQRWKNGKIVHERFYYDASKK